MPRPHHPMLNPTESLWGSSHMLAHSPSHISSCASNQLMCIVFTSYQPRTAHSERLLAVGVLGEDLLRTHWRVC